MKNTLLPSVAIAIGLLACADNRVPTAVDPSLSVLAATATPIFQDGFEGGTLANWDDGTDSTHHRIVTDATLAHSGSRVLEVSYRVGDNGSWLTKFFMPGHESVHVSYWIRLSDTWRGGGCLLGVYGSRTDNQWSAYGKGGRCPTGRDFFNTFLISAPSGDPGPVRFSTYHLGMPRTGTSCWGDEGPATAYVGSAALTRGTWHQVELFVQANTPGQSNGVQRMWIDGVLRGEWRDLRFRDGPELMLNSVQLATYAAGGASYAQQCTSTMSW